MSYMKRFLEEMQPHPIYVQVWLNSRTDGLNFLYGYRHGDPMQLALEFYTDATKLEPGTPISILEQAFHELNVDEPQARWAQDYRRDRNRSLSVGDVVVVGESAYACASVGWQSVTLNAADCAR